MDIVEISNHVLASLKGNSVLSRYIDSSYPIPRPYKGSGDIKLVVLGQDPTVKDVKARVKIKTVLNLDSNGSVRSYLSGLSQKLGIDLQKHVYATNVYKNFFIAPPTQIKDIDIFQAFLNIWLSVLEEELAQYENIPVITLGEPILKSLVKSDAPIRLREYWGYTPEWKTGKFSSLSYLVPDKNRLDRAIYTFPHQPSLRNQFYKNRMEDYISYMKENVFSDDAIAID